MDPNSPRALYQNQTAQPAPAQQAAMRPMQQFNPGFPPGMTPQPPTPTQPGVSGPAPKSNPNSTQNTLQIAEIRDGIVIMSDGTFRSVIMVKSVNFDLMSPQEQEAVEFAYQGFLNSLYFPVQIFIRSQRVPSGYSSFLGRRGCR